MSFDSMQNHTECHVKADVFPSFTSPRLPATRIAHVFTASVPTGPRKKCRFTPGQAETICSQLEAVESLQLHNIRFYIYILYIIFLSVFISLPLCTYVNVYIIMYIM